MDEEIPLLLAGKAVGGRVSVIKIIGHKSADVPIPGAFLNIEVKSAGATAGHMGHIAYGGHVALNGDGLRIGLKFDSPSGRIGVEIPNALADLLGHRLRKPPKYWLLFVMV